MSSSRSSHTATGPHPRTRERPLHPPNEHSDDPGAGARIERLAPDPKDPTRARVELEGGRRLAIDLQLVSEMGLTEGTLLEGTSLKRVLDEGERGAARARALRYLETRERSRVEVERRLARYGYGPELVSEVVKWLAHLGYVDDRRFAQWLVRSRSQGSWGPRRITQDLLSRGVERSIVKEAVGAARLAGADQAQVVDELAIVMQRRFAHDLGADPARAERRISAYLERRGHGWDIIRLVVRRLSTSEMAAAEDDPGNAGVS